VKEIFPGIYQVNLTLSGFNPESVNIYLIKTNDGLISIDSGWDSAPSVRSLEEQLAEIGARIPDIRKVIVTHCHIDHMGLAHRLKQQFNIRVYMHEKEMNLIKVRFTGGDNLIPITDRFLQSHGVPAAELTPPEVQLPVSADLGTIQPDVLLQGGEDIPAGEYTLRVINTPGHTPGHIALYEPGRKLLFSGDVLLPTIATNAAIHVQHIPFPMQQYLDSLLTLKKMDINTVLPGHEHIFSNYRQRIDEIIQNYERKAAAIFRTFRDGQTKTAYEVSRILAWSPRTRTDIWDKLGGWDKRFAVLQTIAHLESLRYNKKLELSVREGINYYSLCKNYFPASIN
jgi:glyoxylase-like metal-dependent hydrolase (beta-lactamase superfamily II)